MSEIYDFTPTVIKRTQPYNGPISSEDFNDTIDEIIRDFNDIANQWNKGIIPLTSTLPDGTDDSSVDAFVNGLDGRTIYLDSSITSTSSSLRYWDSTKERPKTIEEAVDDVYIYVDGVATTLQADLAASSSQLTDAQKADIGINIFDNSQTSSSSSLDGKSENNRQNVYQLAKDLYDATGYSLDNDGNANLTYSIKDQVGALLDAHGGSWDSDISLAHSGITISSQEDVPASASQNDSYAGVPSDTKDDLDQIRTEIKQMRGTGAWTTANTALYGGGADTLEELLTSTAGTGSKSANNPWGYNYDDIDGVVSILDAISGFCGMTSYTDGNPNYSTNYWVSDNTSLETAIGALDNGLYNMSGQFAIKYNEREHLFNGSESFITLSGTPLTGERTRVGYALDVYFNGVKARYSPTPSGFDTYNYNSGANQIEVDTPASGVWLQVTYWSTS